MRPHAEPTIAASSNQARRSVNHRLVELAGILLLEAAQDLNYELALDHLISIAAIEGLVTMEMRLLAESHVEASLLGH